jgi:hypothetical protein
MSEAEDSTDHGHILQNRKGLGSMVAGSTKQKGHENLVALRKSRIEIAFDIDQTTRF